MLFLPQRGKASTRSRRIDSSCFDYDLFDNHDRPGWLLEEANDHNIQQSITWCRKVIREELEIT
jgi:hypothetical protein